MGGQEPETRSCADDALCNSGGTHEYAKAIVSPAPSVPPIVGIPVDNNLGAVRDRILKIRSALLASPRDSPRMSPRTSPRDESPRDQSRQGEAATRGEGNQGPAGGQGADACASVEAVRADGGGPPGDAEGLCARAFLAWAGSRQAALPGEGAPVASPTPPVALSPCPSPATPLTADEDKSPAWHWQAEDARTHELLLRVETAAAELRAAWSALCAHVGPRALQPWTEAARAALGRQPGPDPWEAHRAQKCAEQEPGGSPRAAELPAGAGAEGPRGEDSARLQRLEAMLAQVLGDRAAQADAEQRLSEGSAACLLRLEARLAQLAGERAAAQPWVQAPQAPVCLELRRESREAREKLSQVQEMVGKIEERIAHLDRGWAAGFVASAGAALSEGLGLRPSSAGPPQLRRRRMSL